MMDYKDIISENAQRISKISWWAKLAFHCTDVRNAVGIMRSGRLYSRTDAQRLGVMQNENASRQVIDFTNSDVYSYVRFYFRPLTPTQYYNEGYKHPDLRYHQDSSANIPVPVFFLFDLKALLLLPGTKFSPTSQASPGAITQSGAEAFSRLPFASIYDNGLAHSADTRKYRHAEILHSQSLDIDSCLKYIVCRNEVERLTLLNELRADNQTAYDKYKDIIKVGREDLFYCNGFYVEDCAYHSHSLVITFSDTPAQKKFITRQMEKNGLSKLRKISMTISLTWNRQEASVWRHELSASVDMLKDKFFALRNLPELPDADTLVAKVYLEDKLVCHSQHALENNGDLY